MSYPPKNRKNKFCRHRVDTSHCDTSHCARAVSQYPSAISRGAPVRSVLYDNLKRNCSKFSEATLFVSIPPYSLCNPPRPLPCQWPPAQGATEWRSRFILDHAGTQAHPPSAQRHACNAPLSASCPSNSRSPSRRSARRPGVRVRRAHALCVMLTLRRGAACAGVYLDSTRSRCVQTRRWLPSCVCDGGRDPTRTPAVLCSCQAGACSDASTTRRLHAYVCEGAVENSWQSRPRHTRARNKVLRARAGMAVGAAAQVGMRARSATAPCKEKTASDFFFAIVLASSSNMTRARSAAVVGVGLKTACLGLDCHEFSSKPSHTNSWSTRFLPGHMFPVKAQTSHGS